MDKEFEESEDKKTLVIMDVDVINIARTIKMTCSGRILLPNLM